MSVLNVLDTQTISAAGTGYIVVKTGVIRCYCAAASSIQIDAGPAITLAAGEAILVYCGKPKHAKIASATGANPAVLTIQGYSNGGRHTFSANDYIETVDGVTLTVLLQHSKVLRLVERKLHLPQLLLSRQI